jgi:hypothetical protein
MKNVDAIVLAVRHVAYLKLEPDRIFKAVGRPFAIIDCFCMLNDAQIRRYLELGCEVKGMGRGTRGSFGSSETGGGEPGPWGAKVATAEAAGAKCSLCLMNRRVAP